MKKTLLIILLSIFSIVLLFFICDFLTYIQFKNNLKYYIHDLSYNGYKENIIKFKNEMINSKTYRPVENPNADKKIIIFGCSFAYGSSLKDNETFSHLLGKLTGYRVYNRAHEGRGAQHMLYQLENEDFIKTMPKPDYVIYVFIPRHIRRSWVTCISFHRDFYYKKSGDKLVINSPTVERYISGFFENYINNGLYLIKNYKYKKGETEFYFEHINQSIDDIRKIWGNDVKFVYFIYEEIHNKDSKFYTDNLKKLEQKGVIIIKLSDLSNTDYALNLEYKIGKNDHHPNAKAWEEITPLFVKHLQKLGYRNLNNY